MPKAPTTHEDLRTNIALSDRDALTVAAILPNLPTDESLIVLRGSTHPTGRRRWWDTPDAIIDDFKKRHAPVAPGSDVYRVEVSGKNAPKGQAKITPVPHPFQTYRMSIRDFVELVPLDPDEYAFEDTDQTRLTDFGAESPYFSPAYKLAGEYARKSHLPV